MHARTHVYGQTQFLKVFGYKATDKVDPLAWCLYSVRLCVMWYHSLYFGTQAFSTIDRVLVLVLVLVHAHVYVDGWVSACVFVCGAIVRGLQWPRYICLWTHAHTATNSEHKGFCCCRHHQNIITCDTTFQWYSLVSGPIHPDAVMQIGANITIANLRTRFP